MQGVNIAYTALLIGLAVGMDLVARTPMVDEIFHVSQAGRFLFAGEIAYDPKLTTPPGLYLWTLALLRPLRRCIGGQYLLFWTRATNTVFGLWFPFLIRSIINERRENSDEREAWIIALFPTSFFFYFLYYTDVGGAFFLLFAWQQALKGRHLTSALVGGTSVLFRQTNIIWVTFCAACSILNVLGIDQKSQPVYRKTFWSSLYKTCHERSRGLLPIAVAYLPIWLGFVVFLRWNGGITLGDKSNHQVTLHLMQLPYLAVFLQSMALPHVPFRRAQPWRTAILLRIGLCITVYHFTIEHPFLLADNRHYPHIIWRTVIRPYPSSKYLLVELYAQCIGNVTSLLVSEKGQIWTLGFGLACALSLVPSPLIEPRYFIVPYLIFRCNLPPPSKKAVVREFGLFFAMNAATIGLFWFKKFEWESAPGQVQRVMW